MIATSNNVLMSNLSKSSTAVFSKQRSATGEKAKDIFNYLRVEKGRKDRTIYQVYAHDNVYDPVQHTIAEISMTSLTNISKINTIMYWFVKPHTNF
jgi:hypothetical protein